MMNNKDKILTLFFKNKLKMTEISEELKVSKQYVSRIVRNDERYTKEKERRKAENKEKQKNRVKRYIYQKRKKEQLERINANMEMQHIQASHELSSRTGINNRAFRNWNTGMYSYNYKTKEYRVKDKYKDKVSYAVPKKIKWK